MLIPTRIRVIQLGELNRPEAQHAIGLANLTQSAYHFDLDVKSMGLPGGRNAHKLPNGAYDLDAAAAALIDRYKIKPPAVFLTALPYGDRSRKRNKNHLFLSGEGILEEAFYIVSSHLWESLPPPRPLERYFLFQCASIALSESVSLGTHEATRGCVLDYCDTPLDIDRVFVGAGLCSDCERDIDRDLLDGEVNLARVVAARRLLNRACGRRVGFVAMPFARAFRPVFSAINGALESSNWTLLRADEIKHPRRVADAIRSALLLSDLIIADVTGNNPNVFYELGFAHAMSTDVILLSQDSVLSFDVLRERTLFYTNDRQGRSFLQTKLRQMIGVQ